MQFDAPGRGFSFQRDEPLDMRMDRTRGETAARAASRASTSASWPTRSTTSARSGTRGGSRAPSSRRASEAPIDTTGRLAAIVRRAVPRARLAADRSGDAHVPGAAHLGQPRARRARSRSSRRPPGGCGPAARLVVITFHSLEDRIVKHTLRALDRSATALREGADEEAGGAGDDEVGRNPRARSAKLRAAERVGSGA